MTGSAKLHPGIVAAVQQLERDPARGVILLRWVAEYGLLSWLICWFSHSRYSHVGVLVNDRKTEIGARFFVDHAYTNRPGLQCRPADYARFRRVLTIRLEVTADEAERFHRVMRGQIGAGYDWRAIVGFVFGRPLGFKMHAFDCSCAADFFLVYGGIVRRPLLAKRRMTPGDVLVAVTAARSYTVEERRG
jgi:hypothetical protein